MELDELTKKVYEDADRELRAQISRGKCQHSRHLSFSLDDLTRRLNVGKDGQANASTVHRALDEICFEQARDAYRKRAVEEFYCKATGKDPSDIGRAF